MELILPGLLLAYSLCWYGSFHILNTPPIGYIDVMVYYLSLSHLILSVTYLLFIHPLNMLGSLDLGVTEPMHSLKAINPHEDVEVLPETISSLQVKTVKQLSFDNEALHRTARLTKSGSFPADSSSCMRRRHVPARLDHKQREIWPPSQSANGNYISLAKWMPMLSRNGKPRANRRRGLSLSELEYNSFLPNMDAYREVASGETGSVATSFEYGDEIIMSEGCESVFQSQSNVDIQIEDEDEEYSLNVLKQSFQSDLLEKIETHYHNLIMKSSIKGDRKLIYDLINEALVFIDERRYLYFGRHLHRVHKEQDLLDKVQAFVERRLNWIPDIDKLLESAIEESNWNGGWMNLQIESEHSALELEDLILDELLDEILLC